MQFWGIWKLRKNMNISLHQAMLIVVHRFSQTASLGPRAKQAPKVGRSLGYDRLQDLHNSQGVTTKGMSSASSPQSCLQLEIISRRWFQILGIFILPRFDDPPSLSLHWIG
jgi:hypothetical protein